MSGIRRVRRLVFLMAAVFAATVAGMRGLSLWTEHAAALDRAAATARDLARIVEEHARRTFDISDLIAEQVADGIAHRGGVAAFRSGEEPHRWLRDLAARTGTGGILVMDGDGILVTISGHTPAPPTSFADSPWFQAHRQGADRHVGEAVLGPLGDEILFTYSRTIRDAEGALQGVVQVAMRPGVIQDLALGSDTERGAVFALWTQDGRAIAHTGLTPDQLGRLTLAAEPLRRMLEAPGGGGTLRTDALGGTDQLLAFRRVAGHPVIASVSMPVASALAPFRSDLAWSLWLGGAMLAALGGLSWIAHALGRQAERSLADLGTANAALRKVQAELEVRVAERTRALAEANRQLREKEARFRGIFDAQFQFIGLLTPEGTVLEANATSLAFAGLEAREVIGRPYWEARWWDTGEATRARLREAIREAAGGAFVRHDVEVRGADGRTAILDFSLKPVRDEAGRIAWLVPEGRDVTELRAAQARLHEAQKLETLGQLTGGVAHDFNNLLMAVLGNLALLRKRLPEGPRLLRLLDGAVQGAQRGAALTQRLLAFARRQELRPAAIALDRLVAGMDELLRRSLGPAIRIAVDVPRDLPRIRADANQFEMALLNLAVNARDAMPMGGSLVIEAQEDTAPDVERPADLPEGRFVRVAVSDTGTGMDPATLQRATELFFTTKGPGKGSGLGLSMVHGLAAQLGGKLVIRSQPGSGTTVELWLPVAPDAGEGAPPGDAFLPVPAGPMEPLAILLVDDDPLIQAGTAAMLEDLGHHVTVAGTGLAALEALSTVSGFALMVTDFAMPGMNGLELARRAQALRPGLPVLLASGYAELPEGEAPDLVRLSKPYRQEELAAAIARALRLERPSNVVRMPRPVQRQLQPVHPGQPA